MDIITVDSNNTIYVGADIVGQVYTGPRAEEFRHWLETAHIAGENKDMVIGALNEIVDIIVAIKQGLRNSEDA